MDAADSFVPPERTLPGKTNQVTTRLPLIDVCVLERDKQSELELDASTQEIELRLEAWGKDAATGQERIIGEPGRIDV